MARTTFRIVISALVVLLLPPWGLLVIAVYWTSRLTQTSRRRLEADSGENFENRTSLGLPFTSRW